MSSRGKVSVIVPVYGVEKYLEKCLHSICSQSYGNLEILVIDDESKDSSGIIADRYAKKDSRVKVFHIKNRGAAGARNVGLDNCTGEFVFFVDSDDWIEINTIETMVNTLNKFNVDIVQCQHIDEYRNSSENRRYHSYVECDDIQFIKDMIPHWEYILIWNKLYKSELFNGVRFIEGRCIDDEFFTYKVVSNAKRIRLIDDFLYHYRIRKSSAMGSIDKNRQRLIDQTDFVTQRYPFLIEKYPQLKVCLLEHMIEVLMSVMRNSASNEQVFVYAKNKLLKYGVKAIFDINIKLVTKKSILKYVLSKPKTFIADKTEGNNENYFD